jgi:hypothetical protein
LKYKIFSNFTTIGSEEYILAVVEEQKTMRYLTAMLSIYVLAGTLTAAPIALSGGPYSTYIGGELRLQGSAIVDKGRTITDCWWLIGEQLEIEGESVRIVWNELSASLNYGYDYPASPYLGVPTVDVVFSVTDDLGFEASDVTSLVIYDNSPYALAHSVIEVSQDGQVVLDASESFHGNPNLNIVQYEWGLEGSGVFLTTSDPVSVLTAENFVLGAQNVTLKVYDNLGQTGITTFTLMVHSGGSVSVPEPCTFGLILCSMVLFPFIRRKRTVTGGLVFSNAPFPVRIYQLLRGSPLNTITGEE